MLIVRGTPDGPCVARIVETEAYAGPEDRASHARAGVTRRTRGMFGPAGRAYVYLVYGMHHCLNVVCGPDGRAGAVLIRAAEPLRGIEGMRRRRGDPASPDARLAAGPARLCQALDIDRSLDGVDLLRDERLRLACRDPRDEPGHPGEERILAGPRVGVAYAGEEWAARPWRFALAGHPSLSRPIPRAA
jgi:DNA-3-methyladenine glycosylase